MIVKKSTTQRFWAKVEKTDTCWLWTASQNGMGYGQFWHHVGSATSKGKKVLAHRFAYELLIGEIPEGMTLDHVKERCGNTNCVNPDHLEPVTQRENLLRGNTIVARNAARTRCPQGHKYTTRNTYVGPTGDRKCRMCAKLSARRRRASLR